VLRHLHKRPLESLLATWGVSLILVQTARSLFGDLTSVRQPAIFTGGYDLAASVTLPWNRLFIIVLTAAALGVLAYLLYRTRFGLRLRAVVQNRDMSACLGVRTARVDRMAFFLGGGLAGLAGWAMTLVGNVVPNMGDSYIVDSFLVVVTGGVGKLAGTVIAGMGIGLVTKGLEPVFEAVYGKVILLGLIILFLQVRPTGIFAPRGRGEDT
jgi:urea transport system permease protein